MKRTALYTLAAIIVGCGDDGKKETTDSARGEVAAGDTAMAGMDHSKMSGMDHSKMAGTTDTAGPMAGMDHSKMPGMTAPAPTSAPMSGMDHSKMPGMGATAAKADRPAGDMAGMDHSKMPGMSPPPSSGTRRSTANMAGMDHANMPGMSRAAATAGRTTTNMAGMDHSNMPGMAATPQAVSAADVKMDTLITALLNDPVVRQRIQADSSLKRRWDEAARQAILLGRPE